MAGHGAAVLPGGVLVELAGGAPEGVEAAVVGLGGAARLAAAGALLGPQGVHIGKIRASL